MKPDTRIPARRRHATTSIEEELEETESPACPSAGSTGTDGITAAGAAAEACVSMVKVPVSDSWKVMVKESRYVADVYKRQG